MNEADIYFDASGRRILPSDFNLKKAERLMDNFMSFNSKGCTTFAEIVSWLILRGTGYDGGTSSNHLCWLFGVDGSDRATLKNWKARIK
ncbi:hypothetical protein [Megasphaera sp.]|jgi:hypothetical protein|uniref:hypothetical protein n=1 Tax=Megasphaera sp. TaxID=2023260 RepID=UPI003521CEED